MTDRSAGLLATSGLAFARLSRIACAAGDAAMRYYGRPILAERKDDGSPVTAADRSAHGVIVDALHAWTPDVAVVSEEGVLPSPDDAARLDPFWLVDPLDGTKEFVAHNGEFTVNIALLDGGVPVLGVVYAPVPRLLYIAAEGRGAWRRRRGQAARRIYSRRWRPGMPARIVESRSHRSAALERYLGGLRVALRTAVGSSLKFCLVAEGRADLYPRFVPAMEWDVAAGDCVFRNSGVDAPRRSPIRYGQPGFRLPGGFVIGDDDLGAAVDAA
jgi:3'(2'), 5'-bisphosphate nucleotidase